MVVSNFFWFLVDFFLFSFLFLVQIFGFSMVFLVLFFNFLFFKCVFLLFVGPPPWKSLPLFVVCGDQRTSANTGGFHLVDLACFEVKSLVAERLVVIENCFF